MAKLGEAKANPTKAFFVRTLTKDIALEDCVLDLIDNSIDGAWQQEGGKPVSLSQSADLSKYWIEIEVDQTKFSVRDNCGGITFDDAASYAFTFGKREGEPAERYSIGIYGIGMKRAVFKMGNDISIRSTYETGSKLESFRVPIVVDKWLADELSDQWDFDIDSAPDLDEPGVEIGVTQLNEATAASFGNPAFVQNLRRTISRDYSMHLHRGLSIRVNGTVVSGWNIEMRHSEAFAPIRINYEDALENGIVHVEIIGGMTAPPPDDSDPDTIGDSEYRSGWYVVCNGRIVLAADKTGVSGWGTSNWPKWHPQYAGFMGFVLFSSEQAKLLPLTTTKRSVDVASEVYRRAQPRMREVARRWIAYTNQRKQALITAKQVEAEAKPISVFEIPIRGEVAFPTLVAEPRVPLANISYSVAADRARALAKEFGNINMKNREIGVESFNYAYSQFVGEDQ